MPADYEADLHLGYPLSFGPVTVKFLVNVFNLLNAQKPVSLDERYNISEFLRFAQDDRSRRELGRGMKE